MKILIHSNAPWAATGYGQQVKLFAPMLNRDHQVGISAYYGLQGTDMVHEGMPVYPVYAEVHGNDVLPAHAAHFFEGAALDGLVMTLMDIWVMRPDCLNRLNWAAWVPVDHDPAPPMVVKTLRAGNGYPIAMSKFGVQMLRNEGFDPLYVPHGYDGSVFMPFDGAETRKKFNVSPDTFVMSMVAANKGNPSRKCFAEVMMAYEIFLSKRKPGDPPSLLYLHTEQHGLHQGVPLVELLQACRIQPGQAVFCDQYQYMKGFPPEYLARIYSMSDLMVLPSMGEGFGVPVVEAQACGCPVLVSDFSAQRELLGAGWKVRGQKFWTGQGSWQIVPRVSEIVEAMERAYEMKRRQPKRWAKLREQAAAFATQYEAETVYETHWKPALERLDSWVSERNLLRAPERPAEVTVSEALPAEDEADDPVLTGAAG